MNLSKRRNLSKLPDLLCFEKLVLIFVPHPFGAAIVAHLSKDELMVLSGAQYEMTDIEQRKLLTEDSKEPLDVEKSKEDSTDDCCSPKSYSSLAGRPHLRCVEM